MAFNYFGGDFQNYFNTMDRMYDGAAGPAYGENVGGAPYVGGKFEFGPLKGEDMPDVNAGEIGITVVESEGQGRGSPIQSISSALRMGAGNIQFVWNVAQNQPIGGRAKGYGKDIRNAIKEMLKSSGAKISSFEMPTGLQVSGWDGRNGFSNEMLSSNIQEIKDAIKFAADTAGGGGIDIVSNEFPETVWDQSWNNDPNFRFSKYEGEDQSAVRYLVDKRTGRMIDEVRQNDPIMIPKWKKATERYKAKWCDWHTKPEDKQENVLVEPGDYVDALGNKIDITRKEHLIYRQPEWDQDGSRFFTEQVLWKKNDENNLKKGQVFLQDELERFKKMAEERLKKGDYSAEEEQELKRVAEGELRPEEYAFRLKMENQYSRAIGQSLFYTPDYQDTIKLLEKMKKEYNRQKMIEEEMSEEEKERIKEPIQYGGRGYGSGVTDYAHRELPSDKLYRDIKQTMHRLKHIHESSGAADAQAEETWKQIQSTESMDRYAKKRIFNSYAKLAVDAMNETEKNPNVDKDIYVGPELGWPGMYGGHPEEFIEIIEKSRKKMIELLTRPTVKDPLQKDAEVTNPIYEQLHKQGKVPNLKEAKKIAEKHIKGCLDTSHLGMWLNNLEDKPGETQEEKINRFKKWYMDEVKKMQDKKTIGHIQVVDSATGAHGHLPPGQGIFPTVEAVKMLKKLGFDGDVVSEGHEEEMTAGRGRILYETWRAFGAPISATSYWTPGEPMRFGSVYQSSFGGPAPPGYIFGAYVPSNEFKVWTEVPLE